VKQKGESRIMKERAEKVEKREEREKRGGKGVREKNKR
jgi:hypothetical protein